MAMPNKNVFSSFQKSVFQLQLKCRLEWYSMHMACKWKDLFAKTLCTDASLHSYDTMAYVANASTWKQFWQHHQIIKQQYTNVQNKNQTSQQMNPMIHQ